MPHKTFGSNVKASFRRTFVGLHRKRAVIVRMDEISKNTHITKLNWKTGTEHSRTVVTFGTRHSVNLVVAQAWTSSRILSLVLCGVFTTDLGHRPLGPKEVLARVLKGHVPARLANPLLHAWGNVGFCSSGNSTAV